MEGLRRASGQENLLIESGFQPTRGPTSSGRNAFAQTIHSPANPSPKAHFRNTEGYSPKYMGIPWPSLAGI